MKRTFLILITMCSISVIQTNAQALTNEQIIKVYERAAPIVGNNIVLYKKLQIGWNELISSSISEKKSFLNENKEALKSMGLEAVDTIEEAHNCFVENTDKIIEAIELYAESKAASELAAEKYAEAYLLKKKEALLK